MKIIKRGAFSLVELLVVIVILGILTALIMLNVSSYERVDAQVEAKRYVESVYTLRSALFAYFADNYDFPRTYDPSDAAMAAATRKAFEKYAGRGLDDEIARYGDIYFQKGEWKDNTGADKEGGYCIGFAGNGTFGGKELKKQAMGVLLSEKFYGDYDLGYLGPVLPATGDDPANLRTVIIRVW
jgi:prepilin-type N-terminal cleavage/methylation domain-containing protein